MALQGTEFATEEAHSNHRHSLASDYEQRDGIETLQDFFDNSIPFLKHAEVQSWGRDLTAERSKRQSQLS